MTKASAFVFSGDLSCFYSSLPEPEFPSPPLSFIVSLMLAIESTRVIETFEPGDKLSKFIRFNFDRA